VPALWTTSRRLPLAYDRGVGGRTPLVATTLAIGVGLVACGLFPSDEAPAPCGFPPETAIQWLAKVTPEEAGFGDTGLADDPTGWTYVTKGPVPLHTSLDFEVTEMSDGPVYCFFADSGTPTVVYGDVPDDWSPPSKQ
jgi:hypothetical protein